MADYTEDCRKSLEEQKQGPVSEGELRQFFCGTCRNLNCDANETGPRDPMGKRARLQEMRLLHPTIVDPALPKFAPVAQQDFADAKEAAEAWDVRRPRQMPNLESAPVRPDLLAQRGTGPRKVLRAIPDSFNTAALNPDQGLALPQRGLDPWDPNSGGRVVESGATIRLGGPHGEG